ncbi:MAG TPA: TolC family protein [Syntrophorhabdaceae bacterium]|nr:TolC family protein [Syntrophorhabdaceae bacterium]
MSDSRTYFGRAGVPIGPPRWRSLPFSLSSALFTILLMLSSSLWLALPSPAAGAEQVTLDQALARFYRSNYDILVNRYEVDKAYADYVSAKLIPNPNLSVNYTNLEISQGGTNRGDNTQLTVRVDQVIETAGKRGLRTSAASESFEAAKMQHRDVIRNLLTSFYTLYYTINLDKLNTDFAKDEVSRYDRLLQIAAKRYSAGFLSEIDFTKLKLGKIELENNLTNLENDLHNDMDSFNLLLASDDPLTFHEVEVHGTFPSLRDEDLIETGIENRFDLLTLRQQLKAAEHNLSLAKAMRIPDVSLGGEYDSIGNPSKSGIGGGISLNIPLFTRAQGDILKRTAEKKQVELQIEQTKRKISSEIRQALNSYRTAVKVFASYNTGKEEMDRLADKSAQAFALGGITVLELLDAQKTYKDFMIKYHQAFTQSALNQELIKVYTGEMK